MTVAGDPGHAQSCVRSFNAVRLLVPNLKNDQMEKATGGF
jgi:hypothetical protein